MGYFKDSLLHFLPEEFVSRDIGVGDLKAFLKVVAIPLDEFDSFVDDFPLIFDVDNCPPQYLPYLANMLNFPLSGRDDDITRRLQLKNAVSYYQRKGLYESFRILFYSLGYVINLVELWTRDYKSFHRYPGSWAPPQFRAEIIGTSLVMMDITESNRNLRIRVDGGSAVVIELDPGEQRLLVDIANEINFALIATNNGECVVEDDLIKVRSEIMGATSSVHLIEVEFSSYITLGWYPSIIYGIDHRVPNDWLELQENGGRWYKSPHFGVEAFSVRGRVIDADEFAYIRERIELVRPAHTVLNYLSYAQVLSDSFSLEEGKALGEILGSVSDTYPFPICIDRGEHCTYEYIRDGLVPNRSDETRIAYRHIRNAENNCFTRSQFSYDWIPLSREHEDGPLQMKSRGAFGHYFRDGYPEGLPNRDQCPEVETLESIISYGPEDSWCAEHLRRGGLIARDDPTTYLRDGSFTEITWRGQSHLARDGEEGLFTRSGCGAILETKLEMLFKRTDLPGVYFRSLESMATLGQAPEGQPVKNLPISRRSRGL